MTRKISTLLELGYWRHDTVTWAIRILILAGMGVLPFQEAYAWTNRQEAVPTEHIAADSASHHPLAFASLKLKHLYNRLPLETATLVQDTVHGTSDSARTRLLQTTYHGTPLLVKINLAAGPLVTHVGFDFFSRDEAAQLDPIGSFLERHLLDYYTLDVAQRIASMQADKVSLALNGLMYGNLGFTDFEIITQVIQNRTTLQVKSNAFQLHFTCADAVGNGLAITIPTRLDLISGKDVKELDDALEAGLRRLAPSRKAVAYEAPDTALLTPYADTLYVYQGPEVHPGVGARLFFQQRDTALVLLSDARYPLESLNNMLMRPAPEDSSLLRIDHIQYGWTKKQYMVDLVSLIHYFIEDHEQYLGFEHPTPDTVRVVLIFTHRHYQHLHLMTMDWPAAALPRQAPLEVAARLYSHIRRGNIKNLYPIYK